MEKALSDTDGEAWSKDDTGVPDCPVTGASVEHKTSCRSKGVVGASPTSADNDSKACHCDDGLSCRSCEVKIILRH